MIHFNFSCCCLRSITRIIQKMICEVSRMIFCPYILFTTTSHRFYLDFTILFAIWQKLQIHFYEQDCIVDATVCMYLSADTNTSSSELIKVIVHYMFPVLHIAYRFIIIFVFQRHLKYNALIVAPEILNIRLQFDEMLANVRIMKCNDLIS